MSGVQKAFGHTDALRGVNLTVRAGEVHALIGENGAGKSTLMNVLTGSCAGDAGSITLDGASFQPRNPRHARERGVVMIHQELALAPDLNAEANILLGAEPSRWGWLRSRRARAVAMAAVARLGHPGLPLDAPVRSLSLTQQQIIEIARALLGGPRVLVMDEPTSSLGPDDARTLFEVIDRLRRDGVAVVYISHFLEECRDLCDRYTVLRDGVAVGQGAMADVSMSDLVKLMVGREVREIYPRSERAPGEVLLRVEHLAGATMPRDVTFEVRAGEIFGVAGLIGAGRTETLRALFGLDPMAAGSVEIDGQPSANRSSHARLDEGVGLVSENRKEEGLLLNRSIADNLTMTRYGPLLRAGLISRRRQREAAERRMDELAIRAAGAFQTVDALSGGNQQKVAVGRLLHHEAEVLLLDEPTRGVDVGSKVQIYEVMAELARRGRAVVFVSSYLPELLGVCDTIGVMRAGRMVETRPARDWTERALVAAAFGQVLEPAS